MDFKKRVIEELGMTGHASSHLWDGYVDICEKIAKEYRNEPLNSPLVSNLSVADIRNKLTPLKNLCAVIKNLPRPLTDDTDLNNLILKEVSRVEKSIEYLSNL